MNNFNEPFPQDKYLDECVKLRGQLTTQSALIKRLQGELRWAWDNLSMVKPPAAEDSEYDFCVVCNAPEWKHKTGCEGKAHEVSAAAALRAAEEAERK